MYSTVSICVTATVFNWFTFQYRTTIEQVRQSMARQRAILFGIEH